MTVAEAQVCPKKAQAQCFKISLTDNLLNNGKNCILKQLVMVILQ